MRVLPSAEGSSGSVEPVEHAVVIAGGGPTGLVLAGERALAPTTSSSNDAPTRRSTGREPVACRPELSAIRP